MSIVRPALYNGQELKNYGVDRKTGSLWSFHRKVPIKVKWSPRNKKTPKISYPCVSITDKDVFKGYCRKKLTINLHILVHETLNPQLPYWELGITEKEWRTCANSIKRSFRKLFIVNHKDHDKLNYRPKNLEWTTIKGNAEKYQANRTIDLHKVK